MAVVLTLVQTKQIGLNIRTVKKHSRDNSKHRKYQYTYYQNNPTYMQPHITKQVKTTAESRHTSNEIVTIQSSTLSISSP